MCDFMNKPNLNVIMSISVMRIYQMTRAKIVEFATMLSVVSTRCHGLVCVLVPYAFSTLRQSHGICCSLSMNKLGSARDDQARWMAKPAPDANAPNKLMRPCYPSMRSDPEAIL